MTVSREKTYIIWQKMIRCCLDKNFKYYEKIGGRGIGICQAWRADYFKFMEDMGPIGPGQTRVERLDESVGFTPGNCRWAYPNMGCPKGPQRKRPSIRTAREWADMHKATIYLDKKIVEKIAEQAKSISEEECRRVTVPTLIREIIEREFGNDESESDV